jgi:hypothetical protein
MTAEDGARKAEVLRYLRYRGGEIDAVSAALIEDCMRCLREKTRPRQLWRVYDLEASPAGLGLVGAGLILPGQAVARHLKGAARAALMAATLGLETDRMLQAEARRDLTRAVVLDAAANQYIEEICDEASGAIAKAAASEGYAVTARFSPGYGDLPLTVQPLLLSLLDARRRAGLTVTESGMLLPQKSVTAVVGFIRGRPERAEPCAACPRGGACEFRRNGYGCALLDPG